jgi:hypothetical protein
VTVATLYGLLRGGAVKLRVTAGIFGTDEAPDLDGGPLDAVVTIDEPALDETAFARARDALEAKSGVFAVLIGSTSAIGLLRATDSPSAEAPESWRSAHAWSALATAGPMAPATTPARLRLLVETAARAGLTLVEPPITIGPRSPASTADRAVLATLLLGAVARPLVFVPSGAAPKLGLAKLREERALDGWVGRRQSAATLQERQGRPPLVDAALAVLASCAEPLHGKELLREARSRVAAAAAARSERTASSSADGRVLAKGLYAAWLDSVVDLHAADPREPLVLAHATSSGPYSPRR